MVEDVIRIHRERYEAAGVELIMGTGRFVGPRTVAVEHDGGDTRVLFGERVFLNVGTRATLSEIAGRKTHVKPTVDADERESKNQSAEQPENAGTDENRIDQALADSFPASDAPPWTLGVPSPRSTRIRKQKRQRG